MGKPPTDMYMYEAKIRLNTTVGTVEFLCGFGVRTSTLAVHGQTLLVTNALIAPNLNFTTDIPQNLVSKLSLYFHSTELLR